MIQQIVKPFVSMDDLTRRVSDFIEQTTIYKEEPDDVDKMSSIQEDQPIPENWGRKKSLSGRFYYFNKQTNATTYNIKEIYEYEVVLLINLFSI